MNRFLLIATAVSTVLMSVYSAAPSIAATIDVALGSDYSQTTSASLVLSGIGTVNLVGNPIGPGNTDTIIQRQQDATIGGLAIPIQMTALSLMSVAPVNIGGSFFDVFVALDSSKLSMDTGTLSVTGSLLGGTFTSSLSVFYDARFVPVTTGSQPDVFGSLALSNPGAAWFPTPSAGQVLVSGLDCDPVLVACTPAQLAADQAANNHSGLAADEVDFFTPGGATTPLPAALPLFATGIGGLGLLGWCRKRKAQAVA
jgi:hypothetical protein